MALLRWAAQFSGLLSAAGLGAHQLAAMPAATAAAPAARATAELQQAVVSYLDAAASGALPFSLEQRPSCIPGAGDGVFLTGGAIPAGMPVCLYPGLVIPLDDVLRAMAAGAADEALSPAPPPWLHNNSYLLQLSCLGRTFLTDGRPAGLSAQRFAAAAAAAEPGTVNAAWLPPELVPCRQQAQGAPAALRQAALGHKLNHQAGAPLQFDLCPLPLDLPSALLRLVPSLPSGSATGVRWVPLVVAKAPISASAHADKEIFVDYGIADVHCIGNW